MSKRLRSAEAVARAAGGIAGVGYYRTEAPQDAVLPYVVAEFTGTAFGGDLPQSGIANIFSWSVGVHHNTAEDADRLADSIEMALVREGFRTTRDGDATVTEYVAAATILAAITL